MRMTILLLSTLLVAGCSGAATQATGSVAAPSQAATATATVALSPNGSGGAAPSASRGVSSAIVGSWHRTILCDEKRKALADAGLLETHQDWACPEGSPPNPHSHFFTADGQFGSHDPGNVQVDDGDYKLVDDHTLSFPSHSTEFGYAPILVGFALDAGKLTFSVKVPDPCTEQCADAYAWALSAFGTNPWAPGELP